MDGQFVVTDVHRPGITKSYREFAVEGIVSDIKESLCKCSERALDIDEDFNLPTMSYELPDGSEIEASLSVCMPSLHAALGRPAKRNMQLDASLPHSRLCFGSGVWSRRNRPPLASEQVGVDRMVVPEILFQPKVLTTGYPGFENAK